MKEQKRRELGEPEEMETSVWELIGITVLVVMIAVGLVLLLGGID